MKATGLGKQKNLSEFEDLCVSFVREAKGNEVIEGINNVVEPSATNTIDLTPTTTENVILSSTPYLRSANQKKRKHPSPVSTTKTDWREQYFQGAQALEKERHEAELKRVRLESYNLVLKNMTLEEQLGIILFSYNLQFYSLSNVRNY